MEREAIEWFDRPGGEPAVIVAPSRRWVVEATRWLDRVRVAIADPRVRLEHIGSTAVPGLAAKPVLDVQVSVPDLADEARYRPALESLGLILRVREPGHRFFRPPAGEPRTVHVHVCEIGSVWESDQLRFRDALRASPATARSYADLKQHLAETLGHDREAYNRGKSDFIKSVLAADPTRDAQISWRSDVSDAELVELTESHGGSPLPGWWDRVREHSLGWVTARSPDGQLVGFVNVAWDGSDHAFLIDTKTRPSHQHRGLGTAVVARAVEESRAAGCEWLFVDFGPDLTPFYVESCGFEPTPAGLIRLK